MTENPHFMTLMNNDGLILMSWILCNMTEEVLSMVIGHKDPENVGGAAVA